ncbi:PaaI family thioesterase [Bacteroides graminisolvens]
MKKIINPWKGKEGYNCFGCAPANPVGVKMEFYEDGDDIVSQWHLQANYQGWINTLHGGIQSVLLDEICAWAILRKLQTTGVTSKMETRYLKSVDTTDEYVLLRARISEKKRNIILVEAELYNQKGEVCTKALCTYFTFSQEKAKQEMHFHGCDVEDKELELPLFANDSSLNK